MNIKVNRNTGQDKKDQKHVHHNQYYHIKYILIIYQY
jgi:hypothetical protein